jgi:glycolate oxidase FAD binding subunit
MNSDISQQLQQQVQNAFEQSTALCIVGGSSKHFYGRPVAADTLNVAGHCGVLSYEPTELVITARAGTPLADIEKLLDDNGQMLPFEPPAFGDNATIGGTIACNLSGPRRAYAGAARDFLLGCKLINGRGEILSFGGEVMKNVAGYDVSRLMAGAMGTLGVLLEVSLKVLPKAEMDATQRFHCSAAEALDKMHAWSQTPLPLSATSHHDSILHVRLSGAAKAVKAAVQTIGGESMENTGNDASQYWQQLKEQQLDFFTADKPLWRISLASDNDSFAGDSGHDENDFLFEWGGALRWLKSEAAAEKIQNAADAVDGHAVLFRRAAQQGVIQTGIFQPLTPALLRIHKNLKQAFDPANILNPGKLYPEL